jgi:geranylgeranyl pyrophosphate synthase
MLAELFGRGKMLRPLLALAAGAVVGGEAAAVLPGAEAVELLHGASLVHDDIIDEAGERRGLPALHRRVGVGAALVLGDYLLMRSFAVLGTAQAGFEPARLLEALNTLSHHAQECCRGQVQELLPSDRLDPEEAYRAIVRGKTASLFAAAATVGAILGGGSRAEVDVLRQYGLNVGMAFQIQDDVLDLAGEAQSLGKPVGQSLVQGRPMLPLVYLHKYGSAAAAAELSRMEQAGLDRLQLVALLQRENIFSRVRATQERYLTTAGRSLEGLRPSAEVEVLRGLALYAVTREK